MHEKSAIYSGCLIIDTQYVVLYNFPVVKVSIERKEGVIMDEKYDTSDIDLIIENELHTTASLAKTYQTVSDDFSSFLIPDLDASTVYDTISSNLGLITESVTPLIDANSIVVVENMASSAEHLCSSFAAISDTIHPIVIENGALMANRLCNAISIAPDISAAFDESFTAQSCVIEATTSYLDIGTIDKVRSAVESSLNMITATSALHEGVKCVNDMLDTIDPTITECIQPDITSASVLEERLTLKFDFSQIVTAFTKLIDSNNYIADMFEQIRASIMSTAEILMGHWKQSLSRLHELAHLILHTLYGSWEKRPRILALICRVNIYHASSYVNIGLSPPGQVREYVVQIRKTYLLRTQSRGVSEPEEDMPFLIIASC